MPAEEVRKVIREYFDRLLNQRDLTVCDRMDEDGHIAERWSAYR